MEDLAREEGAADGLAEEGGEAGAHAAHRHEEGFGLGEVDKDGDERGEAAANGDERRLRTETTGADDRRDRNGRHRGRLLVAEEAILMRREHDSRQVGHRLSAHADEEADERSEKCTDDEDVGPRRQEGKLLLEELATLTPNYLEDEIHDHLVEDGNDAA